MARRRAKQRPAAREELYPTLDLHGQTADEARLNAARWLRRQQGLGEDVVRLVTGRGLRSKGPPILRGEIEHLLDELRGSVVSEATLDTAGGAFRVVLRPPPARPGLRRATPPFDPALRRQAEETLSELGIAPTPALVEAEVRRLLRQREGEAP